MPGRYETRVWAHDPTIDAPARYRRACQYQVFIPGKLSELSLTLEAVVAGVVSEAEAAIRDLNAVAQPALAPLGRLLLRTESVASSRIEGLQVGAREVARAEVRAASGRKPGPVMLDVLANVTAMAHAVSDAAATERFGVAEIIAIHRRLMEGAYQTRAIAGRIRATQNWIGGNAYNPCGADFVPPPAEEVAGLLDDLCQAVNDDRLPPVVQAALVHAQFETIHPFADGNGRVGRALVHVVLKRRGVAPAYVPPVSVVLAEDRDRYITGLVQFRGDGVAGWVEQFAAAAWRAARLARAYLRQIQELSAGWRLRLEAHVGRLRADAAAWAVLAALPGHPVITAPDMAALTARSRPQVYLAIAQLERAGVLLPLSASRRNRSWEAAGLIELLERLEAGRLAV